MAQFHLRAKLLSRSAGHNSVAAAAYRAGSRFVCERTGTVHNFRRKTEVEHSAIHVPDGAPSWTLDRATLWNKVESGETRINAQLAREIVLGIPERALGGVGTCGSFAGRGGRSAERRLL